jgi:hypothetical protein
VFHGWGAGSKEVGGEGRRNDVGDRRGGAGCWRGKGEKPTNDWFGAGGGRRSRLLGHQPHLCDRCCGLFRGEAEGVVGWPTEYGSGDGLKYQRAPRPARANAGHDLGEPMA